MNKKFDFLSIGGSTMDIMFGLPQEKIIKNQSKLGLIEYLAFELGSKIVSQNVVYTCGGGAANSAVSFARLGFKTGVLSSMGNDTSSQMIYRQFKQNKVDFSLIQKQNSYTAMSFIVTGGRKKEHVIFSHRLANDLLKIKLEALNKVDCQWYYVSSLSGNYWQKNLSTVYQTALRKKISLAWNPGQIQLDAGFARLKKYLGQTQVLLLNKREAIQLVGSSGHKFSGSQSLAKIILSWGVKIVIITEGDKGAYVASVGFKKFQKAIKVGGVNTTGAGDAFGSSFVGGLQLYHGNLAKALNLAIVRSNYVIRKIGAQNGLLTLNELKKIIL
jgi:ribokinase